MSHLLNARPPYNSPGWKKRMKQSAALNQRDPTLLTMIRAKDRPPFVLKLMETASGLAGCGLDTGMP